jgi:hypothetical protein
LKAIMPDNLEMKDFTIIEDRSSEVNASSLREACPSESIVSRLARRQAGAWISGAPMAGLK